MSALLCKLSLTGQPNEYILLLPFVDVTRRMYTIQQGTLQHTLASLMLFYQYEYCSLIAVFGLSKHEASKHVYHFQEAYIQCHITCMHAPYLTKANNIIESFALQMKHDECFNA